MNSGPSQLHIASNYIEFYRKLSRSSLSALSSVVHEKVRFKDPFSDITGIEKYEEILQGMFDQVPDIKFSIISYSYADRVCYLRWQSSGSLKLIKNGPWVIEGVSELTFHSDGRVLSHIDFWDSGCHFYEHIPVLGRLIKIIRQRLACD